MSKLGPGNIGRNLEPRRMRYTNRSNPHSLDLHPEHGRVSSNWREEQLLKTLPVSKLLCDETAPSPTLVSGKGLDHGFDLDREPTARLFARTTSTHRETHRRDHDGDRRDTFERRACRP